MTLAGISVQVKAVYLSWMSPWFMQAYFSIAFIGPEQSTSNINNKTNTGITGICHFSMLLWCINLPFEQTIHHIKVFLNRRVFETPCFVLRRSINFWHVNNYFSVKLRLSLKWNILHIRNSQLDCITPAVLFCPHICFAVSDQLTDRKIKYFYLLAN